MALDMDLARLHETMLALAKRENPLEIWVDVSSKSIWKRDRRVNEETGVITECYFVYMGQGRWQADTPFIHELGYDPRTGYPLNRSLRGEMGDQDGDD